MPNLNQFGESQSFPNQHRKVSRIITEILSKIQLVECTVCATRHNLNIGHASPIAIKLCISNQRDSNVNLKNSSLLSCYKSEELESVISSHYDSNSKDVFLTENSFDKPIDEKIDIQIFKESQGKPKKRSRKLKSKLNDERDLLVEQIHIKKNKGADGAKYKKRTKLMSSCDGLASDSEDLAKRRDVVNKTILRILRRFLSHQYKMTISQEINEKVHKREFFFKSVQKLAIQIFGDSHQELNILHFYLASIIDPKFINETDIAESGAKLEDTMIFYNCLYKYSHTKLVNLFEVKPIGKIYEYFYNQAKDSILQSEESVSKNKEIYSLVLDEFLHIFQGKIDIATLII